MKEGSSILDKHLEASLNIVTSYCNCSVVKTPGKTGQRLLDLVKPWEDVRVCRVIQRQSIFPSLQIDGFVIFLIHLFGSQESVFANIFNIRI